MNDTMFNLYMEIAEAAKNERFCHGNSAVWCIVDINGNDVVINTMNGSRTIVDTPNPIVPHTCMVTYEIIIDLLMESKMEGGFQEFSIRKGESSYRKVADDVLSACREGRVRHFNGGQVYFDVKNHDYVMIVDTVSKGCFKISQFSKGGSWKYKKLTPDFKKIDDDTIAFLEKAFA